MLDSIWQQTALGSKGDFSLFFCFFLYIKHSIENTINFPRHTLAHLFTLTCLKSKTLVNIILKLIIHIHNLFTVTSLTWKESFRKESNSRHKTTEQHEPEPSACLSIHSQTQMSRLKWTISHLMKHVLTVLADDSLMFFVPEKNLVHHFYNVTHSIILIITLIIILINSWVIKTVWDPAGIQHLALIYFPRLNLFLTIGANVVSFVSSSSKSIDDTLKKC